MKRKMVSAITLTLLLTSILTLAFNIQPVKASGTIYIRADGSVEPSTAPISSLDNITYTFTDNIYDEIVVERSNITLDGAGFKLRGMGRGNGIDLTLRSNVTVKNMKIMEFSLGINLYYSLNSIISGIEIASTMQGVGLVFSTNNTLSENRITNVVFDGIWVAWSTNNTISGNVLRANNEYSIGLAYSSNNNILGNTIENNGYGIWLGGSSNNHIYHNNFKDNTWQVWSVGSRSVWDDGYPSGGNYWSNYAGVDTDGDGIGDTPYVIDADNQDRYPLMHPWSPLPVHNINTGLGYATIQEAISAPETLDGHTIFVEAGRYYENVVVNKSLTLVGENIDTTIIDGNNSGTVVKILADMVSATNFTMRNTGDYGSGIYVEGTNCNISQNILTNNRIGLYLYGANNLLIRNVAKNNFGEGIWIVGKGNNILNGNIAYNNRAGIYIYESEGNALTWNTLYNNSGSGVFLQYSGNNHLSLNNMTDNGYNFGVDGESLSDYIQSIDSSNLVNGKPIYYLINRENSIIGPNTYPHIGYLALINSTNIIVENLTLRNTGGGLLLAYSTNLLIKNVDLERSGVGILLAYTQNSTIIQNDITNNYYGVGLESASHNRFYHNSFINNTQQVSIFTSGYSNFWDDGYPSGGNYWSDYTGVDVKSGPGQDLHGSDSIGDVPYIIDADNVDHYPLMNPYGAPSPPTYALTITATVGGTTNPTPGTYSYTANSLVQVTAIPKANYLFHHWELESVNVGSANPYTVLMDTNHPLKAVFSPISPPKPPVGGYSIPIQVATKTEPIIPYIALIAILTMVFTTIKRVRAHQLRGRKKC